MAGIPFGRYINMLGNKITNVASGTAPSDVVNKSQLDATQSYSVSRINHTGTQLAASISDFDGSVRLNRLDQLAVPTGPLNFNNQSINNLLDPTSAQQPATKNYVDQSLAGVTSGLQFKGSVKAAIGVNINVSSPGTTIDGVTPSTGDIVLLTAQTTASQNGPWTYTGSSSAMSRPSNFDSSAKALVGSFWVVRENSTSLQNADSFGIMTNDTTITLGTTSLAFTFIKVAATASTPVIQNIGNGTLTSIPVTHNFNSRFVTATVFRNSSPWEDVWVEVQRTDLNTVTFIFDSAPATNEYTVIIDKKL